MTENSEQVSPEAVARYIHELNAEDERNVEKLLVRQVNPQLYSCQVWFEGEQDPEGFFLAVDEAF